MASRYYSSVSAETTLTATINSSATSIEVVSAVGFPSLFPYTLTLDYEGATAELVDVTAAAGPVLTVVRAVDGTSAVGHSIGARVRHTSSGRDFQESRDHESAINGVHGVTGDVVGTGGIQTLTGKTLTSPAINGGTMSGTIAGTPTFSGAVVLSGTPNISNGATLNGNVAGTPTFTGATVTVNNDLNIGDDLTITGDFVANGLFGTKHARKTGDTSRSNDAAPSNDPDLVIAVAANSTYEINGIVFATSASTTPDIAIQMNGPAGSAGLWQTVAPPTAATTDDSTVRTIATAVGSSRTYGLQTGSQIFGFPLNGMIETAGTAGNFAIAWAQSTSNATATTVKQYSWVSLTKVA